MPGFDRTGPYGEGPRTGRGLGKCNPKKDDSDTKGNPLSDDQERWYGKGMAWRHGRGWFRGKGSGRGPGRGPGRGQGRGAGRGQGGD